MGEEEEEEGEGAFLKVDHAKNSKGGRFINSRLEN